MSTVDFVKSITSDDIAKDVVMCFDELMVLYNIIGNRQDIDICTDSSKLPISFNLLMESEKDAISLTDTMNGLDFSVYSNRYIIAMIRSGATIITVIRKASQIEAFHFYINHI